MCRYQAPSSYYTRNTTLKSITSSINKCRLLRAKIRNQTVHNITKCKNLLINLRSPRDYVGLPVFRSSVLPFFRSFALSPLDGASVREAHCEQASTAVRGAVVVILLQMEMVLTIIRHFSNSSI